MNKILLAVFAIGFGLLESISFAGLAIVGFDAREDALAVVALQDFDANTTFTFTDNEWNGVGFIDSNEGFFSFQIADELKQGAILSFSNADSASGIMASKGGSFSRSGKFNLTTGGDSLYAFTGAVGENSFTPLSSFRSDIDGGGVLFSNGDGAQLDFSPDDVDNRERYAYTGPQSIVGDFSDFTDLIRDLDNWGSTNSSTSDLALPTGSFSAVPEPSSLIYAAIFGLSIVGPRRRR